MSVGLVALVALHVLPTGMSPLRSAVSQYGISRYRTGYRIQTIGYGIAGIGAALGLATFPDPSDVVVGCCGLFAAARIAISWFPMDAPGGERTDTGRRHGVLAICAFAAVAIAAANLPGVLDHEPHPALAAASGVLGVVMVLSFVAMTVDRRVGGGHFGLFERAFYCSMTAWLFLVAGLLAVAT